MVHENCPEATPWRLQAYHLNEPPKESADRSGSGCNVSTSFNFTVGLIASLAAIAIGYVLYRWLA